MKNTIKWENLTLDQKIESAELRVIIFEKETKKLKSFLKGLKDAKKLLENDGPEKPA
jgi:hypothetical protein